MVCNETGSLLCSFWIQFLVLSRNCRTSFFSISELILHVHGILAICFLLVWQNLYTTWLSFHKIHKVSTEEGSGLSLYISWLVHSDQLSHATYMNPESQIVNSEEEQSSSLIISWNLRVRHNLKKMTLHFQITKTVAHFRPMGTQFINRHIWVTILKSGLQLRRSS